MKKFTHEKRVFVVYMLFMAAALIIWNRILFSSFLHADSKQITAIAVNVLLLIGVLAVMRISHHPFSRFGMCCHASDICWGFLLGIVYNFFLQGHVIPLDVSVYKFLNTVFCVLAEELIFRGYVLSELNDMTGSRAFSVLVAAAGFTLLHLAGGINAGQLVMAFLLGLFWGYLRLYRGTGILFSVTMHFLINIV